MKRLVWMFFAMTAAIGGTMLFMIEGQTQLLSPGLARILGTGCFMFSGLFWMMFGHSYRENLVHPNHDGSIKKPE